MSLGHCCRGRMAEGWMPGSVVVRVVDVLVGVFNVGVDISRVLDPGRLVDIDIVGSFV